MSIFKKSELILALLVTLTFMIILDRTFVAFALPFWWIGDYLGITFIIFGIVSSLLGIFISYRMILRTGYIDSIKKGFFLGILVPVLYTIYVIVVVGVYYPDVPFDYWLREWAFKVFLSSLIGCLAGFLLGGNRLQKMPLPQARISTTPTPTTAKRELSPAKTAGGIIAFLGVGAVVGYFAGYIIWILFGQIQLTLGVFPPYAALFPPPLIYQIGWTVVGALFFPFKILPELLD